MNRHDAGFRLALTFLWLGISALLLATIAAVGGGFTLRAASPRISVHNPLNPLVAAVVLVAIATRLSRRSLAAEHLRRAGAGVARGAAWIGVALAIGVFAVSVNKGSFVAAGADASGYLSQARLWERGTLTVPATAVAGEIDFQHEPYALAPLGYRPATERGYIVPTYPPGYPLMMALARRIAGAGAEFGVVPVCAAGLILVTFALGHRIGGSLVGLLSAGMMAGSPTHLFQAIQPMSDVPAAFSWTLSMLLLTYRSVAATVAAGVAAALAGVVRPNLFALVPLAALVVMGMQATWPHRLVRAASFALPPTVVAVGFAIYQRALYGATTESGYGGIARLFSLEYFLPNVTLYSSWLATTHTPLLLLSLLGPVLLTRGHNVGRMERRDAVLMAWGLIALSAALLIFYCLYFVFDNWTYVRFLLPALSGIFVLTALVIVVACRRLLPSVHVIAIVIVFVAVITWGLGRAQSLEVFGLEHGDQRYLEVARFSETLSENAVFLAVQHSGSLSYYTGRPILRWDWIEPSHLDAFVERLRSRGHHVYAVLEDWEEPQMRAQFSGTRAVAAMKHRLFTTGTVIRAALYEVGAGAP